MLTPEAKLRLSLPKDRHVWVQVARGDAMANGQKMAEGDGAAIFDQQEIEFTSTGGGEILVFDLA